VIDDALRTTKYSAEAPPICILRREREDIALDAEVHHAVGAEIALAAEQVELKTTLSPFLNS
jgi:hypothetical protein